MTGSPFGGENRESIDMFPSEIFDAAVLLLLDCLEACVDDFLELSAVDKSGRLSVFSCATVTCVGG